MNSSLRVSKGLASKAPSRPKINQPSPLVVSPGAAAIYLMTMTGSGANLIIIDNRRHDPTLLREARTLQRPSFQSSSYHSGSAMVCQLQTELSRRVRSDGGARCHGRTHHRFAMGPTLRSRLRETVEEICAPCRFILESR